MSKIITFRKIESSTYTVTDFKAPDIYRSKGVGVCFYTVDKDFDILDNTNIQCLTTMYNLGLASNLNPKVCIENHKHLKKVW